MLRCPSLADTPAKEDCTAFPTVSGTYASVSYLAAHAIMLCPVVGMSDDFVINTSTGGKHGMQKQCGSPLGTERARKVLSGWASGAGMLRGFL